MTDIEKILKSEYSNEFDELRKNRICEGYYKYGPASENAGLTENLKNADLCRKKYEETGNREYLVDEANYLMLEFMYPQHPQAHFRATSSEESAGRVGMTIREVETYREEGGRDR